jgi:AGCS family alanine or glycine:cation symporter
MDLALAWDIADTLNGLMVIPNLIGVLVLSPKVVKETKRHFRGEEFVPQSDWKD